MRFDSTLDHRKEEVLEEAKRLKSEYAELKAVWEKEQAELFVAEEQLSAAEHQLKELRDLVVSDPDTEVLALEQLREVRKVSIGMPTFKESS